jgi:hypothetical protein
MQAYWRLGFPGWRIAGKLGIPIMVKVIVCYDHEANVYIAYSDDIGLAVDSESLDGVIKEVDLALPYLLECAHSPKGSTSADIHIHRNLSPA